MISLSINEFFDEFLANKAKFGFTQLADVLKHTNTQIRQPWKKNTMIIDCSVPVTGVPFISTTRAIKTITMLQRSEAELIIEIDVKTLDAPYSDTFTCKENWILLSGQPNE